MGQAEYSKMEKRTISKSKTYEEYQYLKISFENVENVCFQYFTQTENIKYESKTVSNVNIVPVSYEFDDIKNGFSERTIL